MMSGAIMMSGLLLFDWVYYEALVSNTTYKNRDKWVVVFDLMIPRRASVNIFQELLRPDRS